ncbi:hypothetical protein Angca_009930, partial [Angiostrongylus cantonensis]
VSVRLANEDLWAIFHANTTEMVVTKTGRKMFPKLEYTIEGLKANLAYGLVLQIEQVDDNRYKFSGGEWSAAGRGESGGAPKNVMHHDGVMPGSHWMRHTVNFERVKITNNLNDANPSHVSYSEYKLRYALHSEIINESDLIWKSPPSVFFNRNFWYHPQLVLVWRSETEFIAVTAYQNTTITQLKIEHNPFAKGFRDGGERKR